MTELDGSTFEVELVEEDAARDIAKAGKRSTFDRPQVRHANPPPESRRNAR